MHRYAVQQKRKRAWKIPDPTKGGIKETIPKIIRDSFTLYIFLKFPRFWPGAWGEERFQYMKSSYNAYYKEKMWPKRVLFMKKVLNQPMIAKKSWAR